MQLNHDDIEEFKEIYRQEFGEELSDADAERRARQLLAFYEAILQILLRAAASCGSPTVDSSGDDGIIDDVSPHSVSTSHTASVTKSAKANPSLTESHPPPFHDTYHDQ